MLPGHTDDETSFSGSLSSGGDDESIEDTLAREQRWDDLVARLVERAEAATEPSDRAQTLLRAALVYEAKLDDVESAYLILKTAFQEDFTNEAVANELARVTTTTNRWGALVAECEELIPRLPNDRRRVELLLALATFYEIYLRDLVAAEQILDGAVALDPRDLTARRGLATLAARRGDWGRAVEHLASAAEASRNSLEKVRLHLEAASVYETQLSDFNKAARQYQRVLALSPSNAIARGGLDRLAPELDDRSVELVFTPEPEPLPMLETPKPLTELAPAHFQAIADPAEEALAVAKAALERGDAPAAVEALGRALQEQPQHRACREAMIDAASRLGDHAAAAHHRKALLSLLDNDGERFTLLAETARHSRDDARDLQGALQTFQEALELRPDDHQILHDVLDLYSKTKQWKQAVQVLSKLAAAETGKARARYLVATGNILNYELRSSDEAVELYNQALDEDPEDLKTFERIEKILGAKRAWRDEARNFRRMIKRLGPQPPPAKRPLALMLWKGLGEICRTRLKDFPAAVAAFEVCASLDPADASYHEILAELFEREGPSNKALEKRALLLERALGGPEMARHLRAMLKIHGEAKQADRVWCTCAALVACGQADAQEGQWYDRLAARPLAHPRSAVSEDMWMRALYHPREDRRLSRLFAAVAPTVIPLHAKDARGHGLEDRLRLADEDPSLLSQLISYACFVLGVGRPSIYLDPRRSGIEPLTVAAEGRLHPSLVVGSDLSLPRPEREVAFLVGRAVALMRFEHMVLWKDVVSSPAELKALVLGLIKAFQPALGVSGMDGGIKQYHSFFQRHLPPHAHEPLMSVVPALAAEGQGVDVAGWATGAQLTANRAGLVVCGDLMTATRAVGENPGGKGLTADEATADLIRWSVTPEHLALREQLGLAIENAGVGTSFGSRATAAGRVVDDRNRGR
jgi:tetratricopeptide (TPR) repeat protein